MTRRTTTSRPSSAGLGTFAGVFTPSVLTILGLVLFRRLGYIVGGAGILPTLLILAIATSISMLTSLSLAAIATNMRVKGGGDYYVISRSLGVEFGAAIGIVLYLAQAISIAFYCIGLGEAVAAFVPRGWLAAPRVIAAAAVLVLCGFAWAGADVAIRFQYVVGAAIGVALLSFFLGGFQDFSPAHLNRNLHAGIADGPSFWVLFAIFFPAVTGFTQGVSLSGELAEPGRSLPLGTFLAVGVSTLVYIAAILLFGAALPAAALFSDYDSMSRMAWLPVLIPVGLIAATLSSALTSFLGAPRILHALAADRVVPLLQPFAVAHGPHHNPRRGVLLSLAIALVCVALGGINVIAPIISMFFLISYGLLNYATAFEARANSPWFRPRFRWFHWRVSLLGALGCLGVMLMINPWASAVALAVVFAIYQYIDQLNPPERWADSKRDHYFQRLRGNLLALAHQPEHPRNWRPRLLVFTAHRERRAPLVRFASWIEGGAGLTTVVHLLAGSGEMLHRHRQEAEDALQRDLDEHGLEAFALVVATPDLVVGTQTLIQAHTIGPLRANTVLANWLESDETAPSASEAANHAQIATYTRQLRAIMRLGVNVIVLVAQADAWARLEQVPATHRRIDLWWQDDASSRLMLLLAYLMTRTPEWDGARIRLLSEADPWSHMREEVSLEQTLAAFRIDAEAALMPTWSREALVEASRDASLALIPMRIGPQGVSDPFGQPVHDLVPDGPVVALVIAAEDIDLEAEPDAGPAADVADAADALSAAEAQAQEVTRQLQEARQAVHTMQEQLTHTQAAFAQFEREGTVEPEAHAALATAAAAAQADLDQALGVVEQLTASAANAQREVAAAAKHLAHLRGQPTTTEG